MILSLIAAIGKNNELGKGNDLLWKMPADMKHFREITSGHPIIMGRKTFESIGRPLPNRQNIVITRDKTYLRDSVDVVHSLEEAIEMSKRHFDTEVFVIGGAEIFKQAMQLANQLYITRVEAEDKTADVFFPSVGSEWHEKSRETHEADEKNPFKYTFLVYKKI